MVPEHVGVLIIIMNSILMSVLYGGCDESTAVLRLWLRGVLTFRNLASYI